MYQYQLTTVLDLCKTPISIWSIKKTNSNLKYVHKSSNFACIGTSSSTMNHYHYYFLFMQFKKKFFFYSHISDLYSTNNFLLPSVSDFFHGYVHGETKVCTQSWLYHSIDLAKMIDLWDN